ncbi:hypothetical protein D3C80_1903470 [compost metagenome]
MHYIVFIKTEKISKKSKKIIKLVFSAINKKYVDLMVLGGDLIYFGFDEIAKIIHFRVRIHVCNN